MPPILADLFRKRGIDKISDLTPEERKTVETWQAVLSEGEMTLDKLVTFCRSQMELIQQRWRSLDIHSEKYSHLVAQHIVYDTIVRAVEGPRAQRESLEHHLHDLIQN